MTIVQVALPVPLFTNFDYVIEDQLLKNLPSEIQENLQLIIGCRVVVPFGSRKLTAIIMSLPQQSAFAKLKPVINLLDYKPIFDGSFLKLAQWMSSYYIYPIGDTFGVMLPTHLKQGKALQALEPHWKITPESLQHTFSKQAKKQHAQYSIIAEYTENGCTEKKLLQQGITRSFLKTLQQKNLIQSFLAMPKKQLVSLAQEPLTLNNEQQRAFDSVHNAMESQQYQGFLLNGVTGSGKTEIYLQLIYQTIKKGNQALVLVPEIGLTPQTLQRFQARFHATIVTLHSRMNDTERLDSWTMIKTGLADIIIGTRSAVLASFSRLGLIIVDEEHDSSYKQQTSLRYHARDVALYRGMQENCSVLLGSATPAVESLYRVENNKLTELQLTERAGSAQTAHMKVLDIRGKKTHSSLCDASLDAISKTLLQKQQVLIFLNRRGYAPALICDACGWVAECPHCDARLTLHYQPYQYLKCHHCDWQCYKHKTCADCNSQNIMPVGTGTAKLEELLVEKFADYPLFRIDADTTRRKNSWQELYQQINKNEPAILLGTQMIAKGHHFPNVTLVVMPNVDNAMISSDFRAPEKIAQLILQVAGRAGRGDKPGEVIIQSKQPDNPQLQILLQKGYNNFAQINLTERKQLFLPPYRFCALVRVEGKTVKSNDEFLLKAKQHLLAIKANYKKQKLMIWGPLPAPMHRKADRYHSQLFILSDNRKEMHQILNVWWHHVLAMPEKRYIKATLDIDPIEF